jgi:cation transport ATPase
MRLAILILTLAITSLLTAAERDNFVFEIEGLTCEEGRHALEEAFDALEHIEDLEVDLFTKELTISSKHGKYTASDLKKVIDSTEESHGPMKGTLKKPKKNGK